MAQPDGYADYVEDTRERGAAGPAGSGGQVVGPVPRRHSASAAPPRRRQRSIRSTLALLLVIPMITLVGLLAYSFTTTIPEVLANRNNEAISNEVGGPLQGLLTQLTTEAALTYSRSSFPAPPKMTPAQNKRLADSASPGEQQRQAQLRTLQQQTAAVTQQLKAQRLKTDAAIAAYQASQAKLDASDLLPAQDKPLASALLAQLGNVPTLRSQADGHGAGPLTVFEGYLTVINSIFPYVGAMPNVKSPVPMFSQSMGTLFMGQALTDVSTEQILGDGALENGGVITGPAYRLFEQTVAAQRQLDQSGTTMLNIENAAGTDPYVAALNSPQFKNFQQLEDKIVADGPNSALPATAQSWGQQTKAALTVLTVGETGERTTVTANAQHNSDMEEYELFGISGTGLILVLISSLLLLRFGRRVTRELQALRAAAQGLAFQRLPGVVSRLRVGEDLDPDAETSSLSLDTKTLEVTETAEAFSAVQRTAVEAAIEQAMLRKAVSNVFRRLARRNQGLLQRQLKMLDEMERGTHDPDALGQLFRLDHLTTRMRQAEGLIILSGAAPGRGWRQPVQVVEVLRGAIGEIEDYVRVDLTTDSPDYLQGAVVADVTHLLAELIENAVTYSPPATRVQVRGGRVANGYVVEVEDRGLGIPAEARDQLNQRLADPPDFDVADSDQLGLFVVSRLAARHGIKVSLRASSYGGTTAIALLPQALVVTQEEAAYLASQEHGSGTRRQTGPIDAGGRMAAAVGALFTRPTGPDRPPVFTRPTGPDRPPVADALTGKRRRDTGPVPAEPGSGSMPALGGPPSLPFRNGRAAGASFPGAAGGHPGATGGFPAATGPFAQGAQQGQGGAADLPRRQKMANLAPQLREERPDAPRGPLPGKSPEQARALLSSIQRGLRTGRNTDLGDGGAGEDGGRGGRERP